MVEPRGIEPLTSLLRTTLISATVRYTPEKVSISRGVLGRGTF